MMFFLSHPHMAQSRSPYILLFPGFCALLIQCEAGAGYAKWTSSKPEEIANTPGTVLASTSESGHLDTIRSQFKTLGRTCCKLNGVDHRDTFVDAVSTHGDIQKRVLYSLSHGGCNDGDGGQVGIHIFKALSMVSNWDTAFSTISAGRRVYPGDLPGNLSYDFVFIVACHAGHEIENSNAAGLRQKFNSQVYVAPRGGEAGVVPCCVPYYNARGFAEEYMKSLVNNRSSMTFQQAFDAVSAITLKQHFEIKSGASVRVNVVFP